jgi:ABC-type phosphate transport system permease subunit
MKIILLDGVPVEALLPIGIVLFVLPAVALVLLIYFFKKWRKKKNQQ